ncbi:histone acetyltransferase subunit NuA4-domain-containing protein, partial [Dipodascopsis tothii]|uniref:histone acetyltransferase subunit NuA4-domain-containing protein n=1 Tax=Dipodascopsis tothii TaxID=44089 RepID=UPI0034CFA353
MPDPSMVDQPADKAEMAAYEKAKKELKDMIGKKRMLDKNLAIIEEQIFKYEGAYLDETPNGNIVRGFDNYLKSSSIGGGSAVKRKPAINEDDRLFSLSSSTYLKV